MRFNSALKSLRSSIFVSSEVEDYRTAIIELIERAKNFVKSDKSDNF